MDNQDWPHNLWEPKQNGKKQGKCITNGTKIKSFFLSSAVSLSMGYGVINLQLNVFLNKKNLNY